MNNTTKKVPENSPSKENIKNNTKKISSKNKPQNKRKSKEKQKDIIIQNLEKRKKKLSQTSTMIQR